MAKRKDAQREPVIGPRPADAETKKGQGCGCGER